ncbi:MotE family protein [Pseudooceanicola sp. 200-1SW]|uniref:MotE family protein n=1 Tax=Pseudooceanicola sp. 200-1SW TaxID=3425949 RepID=UPI003D7F32FF
MAKARKQAAGKAAQDKGRKLAPRRRRGARPRRGTLALIAGLLLGSAAVRVALHSGEVMALEGPGMGAPGAETTHGEAVAAAGCEQPPEVEAMLEAFAAREARLEQREAQLRDRMTALAVADEEIEKKLAQLEAAEAALKETLALADSAAENDLGQLTAVYESMKPKQAAALFETMDPQFSAGFLGRMQPAAAAAVMAGLSSETAYAISVILAGRNSSVPKE